MRASDFYRLYQSVQNCISGQVSASEPVRSLSHDSRWAYAELDSSRNGMAMFTTGITVRPCFPEGLEGRTCRDAASALESWNMEEASCALATVNACLNTPERMEALHCTAPESSFCTDGLDLSGKTVGCVGHLRGFCEHASSAKQIYCLERVPRPGDYPDSACDLLLPQCDMVFITGSTLINKTLPHLLELCSEAYTVLVGPSVPLCPDLLDLGLDRLSGMAVTDPEGLHQAILAKDVHSPYRFGIPFLLEK